MATNPKVGLRWTIGDVTPEGFEALQLSLLGAWKIFGSSARYRVCVNTVSVSEARSRTGPLPSPIEWRSCTRCDLPGFLRLSPGMSEGTGWKLCPLRAFHDLPEIAVDNDCILWEIPPAMRRWLEGGSDTLIAADVRPHFGAFASYCGHAPLNSGIRGISPRYPFEDIIAELAQSVPQLNTEGDEQGLQVAALRARSTPEIVGLDEVSICSPFPPHLPTLGACGAHFVGLNTRHFPWTYYGQNPRDLTRQHWQQLKPEIAAQLA